MSKQAFTKGPWLFEPHRMYGTKFRGETWPFGYLSQTILGGVPSPIFELNPILVFPREELEANARLIAAAPELKDCAALLESLCAWLLHRFGPDSPEGHEASFRAKVAHDALAKAEGRS